MSNPLPHEAASTRRSLRRRPNIGGRWFNWAELELGGSGFRIPDSLLDGHPPAVVNDQRCGDVPGVVKHVDGARPEWRVDLADGRGKSSGPRLSPGVDGREVRQTVDVAVKQPSTIGGGPVD